MSSNKKSGSQQQDNLNTRSKNKINTATEDISPEEDVFTKFASYVDLKLEKIKTQILENIEKKMLEFQKSTEFICQKYDDIIIRLESMNGVKGEVESLKNDLMKKSKSIKHLETRLACLEQSNLGDCLEITGIEENTDENPKITAMKLIENANLKISSDDITSAIRQYDRRPGHPKKILLKIGNPETRIKLLANKKVISDREKMVFLGESLSPYYKQLLWKAKLKGKELKYKFIWFKNGSILMKEDEGKKTWEIKHEDDLNGIK